MQRLYTPSQSSKDLSLNSALAKVTPRATLQTIHMTIIKTVAYTTYSIICIPMILQIRTDIAMPAFVSVSGQKFIVIQLVSPGSNQTWKELSGTKTRTPLLGKPLRTFCRTQGSSTSSQDSKMFYSITAQTQTSPPYHNCSRCRIIRIPCM